VNTIWWLPPSFWNWTSLNDPRVVWFNLFMPQVGLHDFEGKALWPKRGSNWSMEKTAQWGVSKIVLSVWYSLEWLNKNRRLRWKVHASYVWEVACVPNFCYKFEGKRPLGHLRVGEMANITCLQSQCCEFVHLTQQKPDRFQWRNFLNKVMNCRVQWREE
jgi:hypothetical protein